MQCDLFDQQQAHAPGARQTDLEELIAQAEDNLEKVMHELYAIGAPVIEHVNGLYISGEDNCDGEIWADYYAFGQACTMLDDFGVNHKINAILEKYGYFAEWKNPGLLNVCEA